MQQAYFHQSKNRDVGPLSAGEVRQRIRAGQIQTSDKIRLEGEPYARPASDFLVFRDEIERVAAQSNQGRRWVCLKTGKFSAGTTSAMCGPYTRGEIVDLLFRNELKATDYVWREGFDTWKPLNSVEQLRLPIPTFPRPAIAWNNGGLDWDAREAALPRSQPVPSAVDFFGERAMTVALVLVCGLFAVVMWRVLSPHVFGSHRHKHPAYRAEPRATATRAPASKRAPVTAKSPASVRAPLPAGNPAPRF